MLFVLSLQKHSFDFAGTQFMLDGAPFQIMAGEMHPSRIPHQYWRHRIQMAHAMGMNTIAIYVFWNALEVKDGVFDFENQQNNISQFIQTCTEEGVYVILRPGPYVCAEWDFGGIPTRLLKQQNLKVRTLKDPNYVAGVEKYIAALSAHLKPHFVKNGGNILMIQIENEYGSWPANRQEHDYVVWLRDQWEKNGVISKYYTADGSYQLNKVVHLEGAAIGLNGAVGDKDFQKATSVDPNVPVMSAELYPGWLRHWGESYWEPSNVSKEIQNYLNTNRSFSLYVIHGGTNFGLTAGANGAENAILPDLTSYDYGSPISEQGRPNKYYEEYRALIGQMTQKELPAIPEPIPTISIPKTTLKKIASVYEQKLIKETLKQPMFFEHFDQNQGIIIYKTTHPANKAGTLKFYHVSDYAQIYINGKYVKTFDSRVTQNFTLDINQSEQEQTIEILVDSFGHKNFLIQMESDRKGIYGSVTLDGRDIYINWEHSRLPLQNFSSNVVESPTQDGRLGGVFKGSFELAKVADTFIDMSNFKKGYLFVNGYNLGRYFMAGPQFTLYCPGVWLKEGTNEVIVLELIETTDQTIHGCDKPECQ